MKKKLLAFLTAMLITVLLVPCIAYAKVEVTPLSADVESKYDSLFSALNTSSKGKSDWYALCLAGAGLTADADKDQVIADALSAAGTPSGSNVAKAIILLVAIGEDPTDVGSSHINLLSLLENQSNLSSATNTNNNAYALLAYAAANYTPEATTVNDIDTLISQLKSLQFTDSGWGWTTPGALYCDAADADSTAAVLTAVSAYSSNSDAQSMIKDSIDYLKESQNPDGGFGAYGSNVDTDACVIMGLCAAGVDPMGSDWIKNGNSPLSNLLSFANDENTSFVVPQYYDETILITDGYKALVAYSGLRNTGEAFNIYTQAASGSGKLIIPVSRPETADNNNAFSYILLSALCIASISTVVVLKK